MEKNSGERKVMDDMDCQGYGLRDNPKKSWKSLGFADDGTTSSTLKFQCKACGKEFESKKALFGHMRHHSGRERKRVDCQECGRKFQSLKALKGHMTLHPVKLRVSGDSGFGGSRQELALESITVRRKRSKTMRYNNAPNSSLSSLNESSGLVEIDQEVVDAALFLIMLSRGARNWSEFNSFRESSDNDSEIKSLHQNKEIMQKENGNPFRDWDKSFQMKKLAMFKSDSDASASMNVVYEKNTSEYKELDSGIITDKEKKVGSEAPNDMLCRGVEFKVTKVDDESVFELYDTEIEERISGEIMNFRSTEVEPGQDWMEGLDLAGLGSTKSSSCKYAMFDACDAEPGGDSLNKLIRTPLNSEMSDDSQKKNKYKCRICSKTFKSHHALGGHQTIHRKRNSYAIEEIENREKITQSGSSPETEASCKLVNVEYVENSVERELNGVTSYGTRVYKVYKCGICFKVFASGQALGGHKRSHILKEPGTSDKQPAKQLKFSDISDVTDLNLNLPVMHDEEANGDIGFKSCRVGSDCKSEALLSLVAN
ncbi:uncharacterized protein LOC111315997 [Durio zibethinus]|uniref:Uncharacterized protein LOC111315997 n=1 Tax=Durio zibethinus TaxID=66656 RepID=A0A6P6B952_DURZI|nr:uncharacterized protein LOC111315997 [Durio zibethinus]